MSKGIMVYIVKDEELLEVYGKEQLVEFAKEQAQYLIDYVDSKSEMKVSDVNSAKKILNARGFSVEEKLVI